MLDSRHLQMFHEVVRTGSYSAAARTLGYTQPAVSQRMRALERSVGTPLFTRCGRTLRLTEAGAVLARRATEILEDLTAAEHQVTAISKLAAGGVRVCTFPSASATIVAAAVARLNATQPGIRVQLLEAEPPDSLALLQAGKCDITLGFSYPGMPEADPEHCTVVPLLDDEMVAVLPVDHPLARRRTIALPDLSDETWIAGCPRCRAHFVWACEAAGFEPEIAFTTDDTLAVQSLVVSGIGVAVMPSLVLSFLRHPHLIGRPSRPAAHRSVAACTLTDYVQIPATATMLDALRAAATQLQPGRAGPRGKATSKK